MAFMHQLPVYGAGALYFLALMAVAWVGYRIGHTRFQRADSTDREISGLVIGGLLGILGLMLAFSFSFTLSRHEARREAAVIEANVAGTAFLRADLLPDGDREVLKQAIYEYTKSRDVASLGDDPAALSAAIARSIDLLDGLWPIALGATRSMNAPERTFVLGAMNALIDEHGLRLAEANEKLPLPLLIFLLGVALLAFFSIAYNAGSSEGFPVLRFALYALVVSWVIALMVDFDQSQRGLIRVDTSSLRDTIAGMEKSLAGG